MKLKIRSIDKDKLELWLEYKDNEVVLRSRNAHGVRLTEFILYPNGSWVKCNAGTFNDKQKWYFNAEQK